MRGKSTLITNSIICAVLLTLAYFVFTLDLNQTYLGITAPLYNGDRNGNEIAIAFIVPDNVSAANLPLISEALKTARAGATFFVSGMAAAGNLELFTDLSKDFEIGNGGFSNMRLDITDKPKIANEIAFCRELIASIDAAQPKLFTPPGLFYNKTTLAAADELGYMTIMPSARKAAIDWATADTNMVASYAAANVAGGDIIFLHPTHATMQAMPRILAWFLERDLQPVSVGALVR